MSTAPMHSNGCRRSWRWTGLLGILLLLAVSQNVSAGSLFAELQELRAELTSEPDRPLRNTETSYALRLTDPSGRPVTQAKVTLAGSMADGMAVIGALRPTRNRGTYVGRVIYTMGGEWKVTVRVVWTGEPFELQMVEQGQ